DEAAAREAWTIVGCTRVSPVFPFNRLNYAFGRTRVSFREYLVASWIGMLPGTILYVYIGSLAGNVAQIGSTGHSRTRGEWAFYRAGLFTTVTVNILITQIA